MTDDIDDTMTAAECDQELLSWWKALDYMMRRRFWNTLTYEARAIICADEQKGGPR